MNKRLVEIREELQEMAEKEAMKLWRIAEKSKEARMQHKNSAGDQRRSTLVAYDRRKQP